VFARVHTLATTSEQAAQGYEIVKSLYLPWARDSTGFRGLIRMTDDESGKTIVVTLWADEDALHASDASAEELGQRIAEASGATYRSVECFEVSLFDVELDSEIDSEID
jgi:heme-degrading monooxygenase HmoA